MEFARLHEVMDTVLHGRTANARLWTTWRSSAEMPSDRPVRAEIVRH
ncbi:hypothetical protein KCH_54050 [Kitasatospora cheerisanensis KCTC 2395]|uniref:Uncharacterized protein n=1 Tax=Kitasatospora cheerisanensis KCTC 2395 TaxID=1348663 RepID=A0A066YXI6_9ACTN|nr:hypothetical protein KCH_54050 [Kitasatospora cheerisanensis KCTC 2395]